MADEKEIKTVSINFRIEESTKEDLEKLADADSRTLSNYIRVLLEKHVEKTKKK